MNLAGLKTPSETLFQGLHVVPKADEFKDGEDRLNSGRVVKLTGYETKVFDMHDTKQRAAYSKLMLDLTVRQQTRRVQILADDRQVMTRKDGTTGWFRYLEWMEFDWAEEKGIQAKKGK